MMQDTFSPMNHRLLSPVYVQPMVDKYIVLTYQYLEERANQYNGLNIALRDFIVPLTFDTSGHAFSGKTVPSMICSSRLNRSMTTFTLRRVFRGYL